MMRIKLLFSPRNHDAYGDYPPRQPLIPPLGMAVVTGVARRAGFKIDQDDLDIKVYRDNQLSAKKNSDANLIDMDIFNDIDWHQIMNSTQYPEDDIILGEAERILNKTDFRGYDIYGFSMVDETQLTPFVTTIALAKILKEKTDACIVAGGFNFSRPIPEINIIKSDYIDYLLLCGASGFIEFLEKFENGDIKKLETMDWIVTKQNLRRVKSNISTIKIKNREIFEDYCSLPDFTGLPLGLYGYRPYHYRSLTFDPKKILVLPVTFIRGCPNKCIFCPSSQRPYKLRHLEINEIITRLEYLKTHYDCHHFMFLHDNINLSKQFAYELCKQIIESDINIKWADCATFKFLDKALLELMKKSGAVKLIYGIESASPRMMKYIKKPFTLEYAMDMLKISHNVGIWNEVELIAGLPYENDGDIQNTIEFINKSIKYVDYFYLNKYLLLDSEIYNNPEKYGIGNIKDKPITCDFPRRFDELNGLPWREKKKQITNSYKKILHHIQPTNAKGYNLPLLFYLSDFFDNKNDLIAYYKEFNSYEKRQLSYQGVKKQ